MKYGIMLPSRGDLALPENIIPIARKADELGFAVMMFPDHIVMPNDVDSPYPYTQSGTHSPAFSRLRTPMRPPNS